MTLYYALALVLIVVAILFVVLPLIIAHKQNQLSLSNTQVIKQRISELSREVEEGLIDEQDKEIAIKELKVALIDELPRQETSIQKLNPPILIVIALVCSIIGAWVYWNANQLSGLQQYNAAQTRADELREQMTKNGTQGLTPDDFATLALSIRRSLRENPQTESGWRSLALVNSAIGRLDESIAAYEKALDLNSQDKQLRFKYAETLMLKGSENSLINAQRQLQYLISNDPNNRNYRLLLVTVAVQLGDAQLAATNFDLIKSQINPNSQFYQSMIVELQKLGINNLPTPEVNDQANSNDLIQLNLKVEVSEQLKSKLPPKAYLIVFAQHNDGNIRAPLAVKRIALSNLPVNLTLSDADAMIAKMNLSSAKKIKVTARISIDEDVMPSAGEFEGSVTNIDVANMSNAPINILIDKEL